ncbi:MAG: nuclear transport factor 2 family protein [Erysipelotrichales bacterium]|nr:nuclear transport factor 2 family protein [Erysipelotrichales bacterium]
MGNMKIIELINGHLADLERGNVENLCRDWIDSFRALIIILNKPVQGYENICLFYKSFINKYSSRILRLNDLRIERFSEMACIYVTYTFKGVKDNKTVERNGKGEIVLEIDENTDRWQLCNVRFR